MIILGIDPGTAVNGWALVHANDKITHSNGDTLKKNLTLLRYGCIVLEKETRMEIRLKLLKVELDKLMAKFKPDSIVVEKLFFGINVKTAMSVAQARGVIMLACAEANLTYEEYTGLQVKKGVSGDGRADKKMMQEAVRISLGLKELPEVTDQIGKKIFRYRDDAADALACAIFHFRKQNSFLEE